jgi:DNA-binding response OmpR family regulator
MGDFMSDLQMSMPATLVSPGSSATTGRHAPAAVHMCLVVSMSARRAQLLVRAAHDEHWATIVCNTAEDALRQSVRQRVDLALVDLQSAPASQERVLRLLVEQLAARNGPLLAVCGKPDDITGEVWSRQLGVWMYLPGVDNQSDIALLCAEARNILQKLGNSAMRVAT